MQKRWSKAEIAHLKRHASSAGLEELAQKSKTDVDTVRRKLEELGLTAQGVSSDAAAVEAYAAALKLLHAGKWNKAAAALEGVIAQTDNLQLADRARQSLATCRRHGEPEPDGGDPYLKAVIEKNNGNFDAALELCQAEGREDDDERYAYLLASLHSLAGAADRAIEHLRTAIRLEPRNRVHAYHDPDFAELRNEEEFNDLVADSSDGS